MKTVRISGEKDILNLEDALERANNEGKDLIQISATKDSAICVVDELSKFLYKLRKGEKASTKSSTPAMKELQFSLGIGENDIIHKCKNASKFIEHGHKVKLVIKLSGRENARKDFAASKLSEISERVENAKIERGPVADGNTVFAILVKKR